MRIMYAHVNMRNGVNTNFCSCLHVKGNVATYKVLYFRNVTIITTSGRELSKNAIGPAHVHTRLGG